MTTADIEQVASAGRQDIRAYDFQLAGRMNEAQIQAFTGLNEGLVRNLSLAFSSYLGVPFSLRLDTIEELPFGQFATQLPANTYVSSMLFQPQHTVGGMQLDLAMAFPMLELMLGGPGNPQTLDRGLTEIEEALFQDVARVLCVELEKTWDSLDISVNPGERLKPAQLQKLFPPEERVMALRLEATLQGSTGALNLFLPIGTAGAMLRKLTKKAATPARPVTPSASQRIQERLLDCICEVELKISGIKVPVESLLYIEPGKLIDLGIPVSTSAQVCLEGNEWFEASPVRAGSFRAARLGVQIKKRSNG